MKKLTIDLVAPYLPYGLLYSECGKRVLEMHLKDGSINCILEHDGYRPILRPLSDLTKEIDDAPCLLHQLSMGLEGYCDAYDEWIDAAIDNPKTIAEKIIQAPYEIIQELLKEHFDIFNIIPEGLAIDKNTI